MTRSGRRSRWRIARIVVLTAIVLGTGAAAAAASGVQLARPHNGTTQSNLPPATAKVTRQTLVETETVNGKLGHGDATKMTARLGGTVTWLAATDAVVQRGQVLYRIDNKPVVLTYGALPAYRALSSGLTGADIKQFESNLYALGYRGFTVDETYSDATVTAVKKWQRDLGLDQTGTVDLGRVLYADGPVRIDTQTAAVGDQVQPSTPVLNCTGTTPVIVAGLDPAKKSLAVRGAAVEVTLPDGKRAGGKVTRTRSIIDTADLDGDNDKTDTVIEVTVAVDDEKALAGLDQASVQVILPSSRRENVLAVPVAALLALSEGGYGVQVVEGSNTRIIAVQTGVFADGRVEVSAADLREGIVVGVPS